MSFFDTDCLSSFLWTKSEELLPKLYVEKIVIPRPVYIELSRPVISHLKKRLDILIQEHHLKIQDININSKEFNTYYQMTEEPLVGNKVIGKGEASALALAIHNHGIVASNNLRDILPYVNQYSLKYMTTGDILADAYGHNLISEEDGNVLWANMFQKRRYLGADSFSSYLKGK